MKKKWFWIAPAAILAMGLFIAIGGQVVMLLWNWLVPSLIGWRAITFWQAVGLLALCRILFGHHGWGGHGRSHWRRRAGERCGHMTPEERERFREVVRERWGGPAASQSGSNA
jgi:hypothetical protein